MGLPKRVRHDIESSEKSHKDSGEGDKFPFVKPKVTKPRYLLNAGYPLFKPKSSITMYTWKLVVQSPKRKEPQERRLSQF